MFSPLSVCLFVCLIVCVNLEPWALTEIWDPISAILVFLLDYIALNYSDFISLLFPIVKKLPNLQEWSKTVLTMLDWDLTKSFQS